MRPAIVVAIVILAWYAGRWLAKANRKSLEKEKLEGLPDARDLPSSVRLGIGQKLVGLLLVIFFPFIAWYTWTFARDPEMVRTSAWLIGAAFLATMILATTVLNIVRKRLLRAAGEEYRQQLALGPLADTNSTGVLMQTGLFLLAVTIVCGALGVALSNRLAGSSSPESAADFSNCAGDTHNNEPLASPQGEPGAAAAAPLVLTVPGRAANIPRAPLNVQVYFVPIGNLTSIDLPYLVRYYQQRFDLTIAPLPAIEIDKCTFNTTRRQNQAEGLIQSMEAGYPKLAGDGRSVLIGITEADIYIKHENWGFALGLRHQGRYAVVCSARMNSKPLDTVGLHRRLTRMISREIGFLYYGLPFSRNERSVVRSSIMGADELDGVGEDF